MKYLVTGVKGQLGFDVVRELKERYPNEIIKGIDIEDLDITDDFAVNNYINSFNPDVVFHNAAYTAVDNAEDNEDLVNRVNVFGTSNLVAACKNVGAKIIFISTDYVFDGTKEGYYNVDDMPNPLSIYGKSKLLAENIVKNYEKHFIVRISWAFGKNGNNFVKTMLRLAETRTEISVVVDQIGSPTYTYDLARLLVDLSLTTKYGIYHATNEGVCSWNEFAKKIFELTNKNILVNEILSKDYKTKAIRPKNSKLSKDKLIEKGFKQLPNWEDALERYLKEIGVL